jgi:hypothetical protein
MNLWKQFSLSRLFGNRTSPARSRKPRSQPARFRPGLLALEDRTVPSADLFAQATVLDGRFASGTGNTDLAGGETGEPAHAGDSGSTTSIWWQWTAPASGTVEVNTFGSDYDTLLGVYVGSSVEALEEVASNDDADSSQSQVLFEAVAGTTYRIAVDGFGDATGNVVLHLGMTQSNDNFANATVVTGGTVLGSNAASTGELGEPAAFDTSMPINSVWWSWTASAGGATEINTFGSDFDTQLAVYTGSSVGSLTLVVANDDSGGLQSQVFFNAAAGVTYYIAVDGFLNETGTITLNLPATELENNPPVIGTQSFSINENSFGGTVVGAVAASDPDGHSLSYFITGGNDAGLFFINPTTGVISVANNGLNFEADASYELIVQVTDNGTPALSSSATVTVNLNDVNETPVFTSVPSGPVSINENSAAGTAVGAVAASDVDANQTLSYAIVGGNTNGAFAINGSGQIVVANAAALDFETNPTFTLTVRVSDSGSPSLFSDATVTVNLSDVDENVNLSPTQRINLLGQDVQALVNAGVLTASQGSELQNKLNVASNKVAQGNNNAAINNLQVFIKQVQMYVSQGVLSQAQGDDLISDANAVIAALQAPAPQQASAKQK